MVIRWLAALAAFAVVAFLGIGVFGDFSEAAAGNTWALIAAVGLAVGFITYAVVEYLQTRALRSISQQFDTRTIVLMPLAIAINIILGAAVANALKIPIYLDSIGTILVGALAGPIPGALTGFLANILWQYVVPPPFQGSVAAPFAIVAAVIGLMAGLFSRYGWLRPRPDRRTDQLVGGAVVTVGVIAVVAYLGFLGYQEIIGPAGIGVESDNIAFVILGWLALALVAGTIVGLLVILFVRRDLTAAYVVVGGLLTGIVAALISAPISANLFGGVTGAGTDFLVAAFRQAGADIGAATLGQGLISDPIDKITTFFVVYLILSAMARRTKARFPQGEKLIDGEDAVADDSGEWRGAPA
ncbi:MAG: ECF transporter S component [Chloroflexi bacterium]|nr:ECF transporter S component [Chloroflexota bacterium]